MIGGNVALGQCRLRGMLTLVKTELKTEASLAEVRNVQRSEIRALFPVTSSPSCIKGRMVLYVCFLGDLVLCAAKLRGPVAETLDHEISSQTNRTDCF